MLPFVQSDSARATTHRICPHWKKRPVPSAVSASSINVHTSLGLQVGRYSSVSSTAPLMSGGRSPGLYPGDSGPTISAIEGRVEALNLQQVDHTSQGEKRSQRLPCWKCVWEECVARAGHIWLQTAGCLCFVCCGYECDDDSTVYWSYPYGAGMRSGHFDQCTEIRREVLEQTPASMV